jgi:hypothetical protein
VSITPSIYSKARSEITALFGWNAESLSPDQTLRVDCAVALRLALDDLQGRIVRGESADVARMLTASEALARLLPPAVLATPPSEPRSDPRQVMWEIYKTMRERGELGLKALPPEGDSQRRISELEGEIARLKAGCAPALLGHDREEEAAPTAIDPTEVVPPSEWRGETYAGPVRPGIDDPPRRSPPIIESVRKPPSAPAAVAPAPRPAAPAYDYDAQSDWKNYVLPSGEITPTPFSSGRRWWGPV